jgi:predicted ATPase
MVGRAAEWALLATAYERGDADPHLMVVEGEAGIGKTRLAEEFLTYVRSRGGRTMATRCYHNEVQLAYAPVTEGLRAALAHQDAAQRLADLPDHALAEAARLLPELTAELSPPLRVSMGEDPGAQGRFLDSLVQVLLALLGETPPGLLVVDDAHLADEGTLDLLTFLVRRVRGRPVGVLVTWRSEELPAEHRLRRLVAETRRAASTTTLLLGRLGSDEVGELVRAASADAPARLAESVFQETDGLPFFVVEYLRALTDGEKPGQLLGGVRELLQSRLLGVSEAGMQLLTTAAVIGRLFEFDALRQASGRSDDETVAALEELRRRGLVREVPAAGPGSRLNFDFSHVWLRELVYEETSLSRRRLLHRRVAEALESRHAHRARDIGPLAGQIALHYQRAGHESQAAEFFRLAGEHARSLYANAESLSHFRAALALGHPAAASLHESIGDLLTLAGQYAAALTSYELAAALCGSTDLPRVEHKLGQLYCRWGEWQRAESHFSSAEAEFTPGLNDRHAQRARLYADWSLAARRRGDIERAVTLANRALELAQVADDAPALVQAHNVLGIVAGSRQHLERSLALAEMLNDRAGRIAALNNLALAYGASSENGRAIQTASAALELCVAQGDRHHEAALHNNLADLLHAAGRSEEAMVHLKQAVTIFAEVGSAADPTQPEIWKLTEW